MTVLGAGRGAAAAEPQQEADKHFVSRLSCRESQVETCVSVHADRAGLLVCDGGWGDMCGVEVVLGWGWG